MIKSLDSDIYTSFLIYHSQYSMFFLYFRALLLFLFSLFVSPIQLQTTAFYKHFKTNLANDALFSTNESDSFLQGSDSTSWYFLPCQFITLFGFSNYHISSYRQRKKYRFNTFCLDVINVQTRPMYSTNWIKTLREKYMGPYNFKRNISYTFLWL